MKGAISMYDHKWKARSLIFSAVALIAMVAERLKGFIIFKKLSVDQHYGLFKWFMLCCLASVIYCKEQYDDDRAKMIRLKSLQISFLLFLSVLLGMGFTATLDPKVMLEGDDLLTIGAMGIILYLLVFHIGLYFDFLWDFKDRGAWENLKNIGRNKWGLLVYFSVCATMLLFLTLL